MKTLLIDNYDSYTYNLYHLLHKVNGELPIVVKNDEIHERDLQQLDFDNIVISPGPGHPGKATDFGICAYALKSIEVPILGVCLGHQGMAEVLDGSVTHAPEAIHGRRSAVHHEDTDIFAGIPQGFHVVRYHSLVVDPECLPKELVKTAWTEDGIIMGLRHVEKPIWGVQFHPESIETEYGFEMLQNFKQLTEAWQKQNNIQQAQKRSVNENSVEETNKSSHYTVRVRKINKLYDAEQSFVSLFGEREYAFWLDSSRHESGMARFSFMGTDDGPLSEVIQYDLLKNELKITKVGNVEIRETDIYTYLNERLETLYVETDVPFDFNTGVVGYLGYELKALSGGDQAHPATTPDAYFILADRLIAFDHEEKVTYLLELVEKSAPIDETWFNQTERALESASELLPIAKAVHTDELNIPFNLFRSHEEYRDDIARIKKEIINGETYEITLTNELTTELEVDALMLYRELRATNPAPYASYMRFGDIYALSSSPERFVKVDRARHVSAKPIKGTIKRGANEAEDQKLLNELKYSEKNRAENLMIVDLLRNDLGLVCDVGSVDVPKLMDVETFETVHQLVSTVTGTLRKDVTIPDLVRAAYAGGSMTGAPKIRSMQLIDEIEGRPRGIYSGTIGFIGLNQTADLSIVIRTIVKEKDKISIGVGGAITLLSNAEEEYEEMLLKAKALVHAICKSAYGQDGKTNFTLNGEKS